MNNREPISRTSYRDRDENVDKNTSTSLGSANFSSATSAMPLFPAIQQWIHNLLKYIKIGISMGFDHQISSKRNDENRRTR